MERRLRVLAGPHQGASFQLPEAGIQRIGRSHAHNDICLPDPHLARVHCEVEVNGEQVEVRDCDSESGTFVNEERITKHRLQHGDVLRIGDTQLAFMAIGEDKSMPPASSAPPHPSAPPSAPEASAPATAPSVAEAESNSPASGSPLRAGTPPLTVEALHGLAGTTLGQYELGPALGTGHAGLTFRARTLRDGRVVALKVLHPVFPKNDEEMLHFAKGMQKALALRHPHLVTVFEAGQTGAYGWIAQEYVEGETLAQAVQRAAASTPPEWTTAFRVAVHVGRALHYAGRHRLIHCNITPPNILLRSTDHLIKLNDLLLARALSGSHLKQLSLRTKVHSDVAYLSPEQTHPRASVAASTDLFSLGTVVYALLTGRFPFAGKSVTETIVRLREAEPVRPKERQPAVPEAFEAVVLKMLAKRPEQRFQTAGELLTELARIDPDPA
jgi:serine/threonine protein kinase